MSNDVGQPRFCLREIFKSPPKQALGMNRCSVLTESWFIFETGEWAIELKRVLEHVHAQGFEMIHEGGSMFFSKVTWAFRIDASLQICNGRASERLSGRLTWQVKEEKAP